MVRCGAEIARGVPVTARVFADPAIVNASRFGQPVQMRYIGSSRPLPIVWRAAKLRAWQLHHGKAIWMQLSLKIRRIFPVTVAVLALGWASVATAADGKSGKHAEASDQKAEVEKKGESKKKAEADKKADGEKAADKEAKPDAQATPVGEDALRLGTFSAPPKPFPFPLLGDDRAREVFVDRAGQLYKDRPYSGHVPDWNATQPVQAGGRCKVEPQQLQWVGFQNNADGSRVFVQLEKAACGYVYRPDDLHVVIDLPQVTIANPNLKRELLTGAFPTSVDLIRTEDMGGRGVRIVIALKERRAYLSAHLGKYVFVDITR